MPLLMAHTTLWVQYKIVDFLSSERKIESKEIMNTKRLIQTYHRYGSGDVKAEMIALQIHYSNSK
jgi:hypothetical protein